MERQRTDPVTDSSFIYTLFPTDCEQWNDKGPGSNHGSDGPSLGNEAVLFSDSNYLMVDNDPLINLTAPAVFFVGRFLIKHHRMRVMKTPP